MGKPVIILGSDHAGFRMKEEVKAWLVANHFTVKDYGVNSDASFDYPDIAHPVASAVEETPGTLGLLLCGSANGVAITANKHQGIRAAICWTEELASLARLHNNANVLCLPARFIDTPLAERIIDTFVSTSFEGGRHSRRVDKISC
jgi:ribose 5-phosphate isomerase B